MFRIWHYIMEVYREQSFSHAAQKLFLSQPSLSLTIKRFEKEMGVQIFDRSSTPVKLTDAGEVFIQRAQQILAIERDLKTYVDDYKDSKVGTITLGSPHLFCNHLLPRLIARFLKMYPQVKVQLVESDFLSLVEITQNGDVDLLVESEEFDETQFQIYPLFIEKVLLAVPESDGINDSLSDCALTSDDIRRNRHVSHQWPCVPLERFARHSFLMLEKGHDMHRRTMMLCRESNFEPKVFMWLNQLMTAYSLASQQLGVTFVSDTTVKLTHTEHLRYYKLEGPQAERNINMVHRSNCYVSKATQQFIKVVQDISRQGISVLYDIPSPER